MNRFQDLLDSHRNQKCIHVIRINRQINKTKTFQLIFNRDSMAIKGETFNNGTRTAGYQQTNRKIPNTYLTPIYIDNTKAKT